MMINNDWWLVSHHHHQVCLNHILKPPTSQRWVDDSLTEVTMDYDSRCNDGSCLVQGSMMGKGQYAVQTVQVLMTCLIQPGWWLIVKCCLNGWRSVNDVWWLSYIQTMEFDEFMMWWTTCWKPCAGNHVLIMVNDGGGFRGKWWPDAYGRMMG